MPDGPHDPLVDLSPEAITDHIARLDQALEEARELQEQLRRKMVAQARESLQTLSHAGRTKTRDRGSV